MIWLLDFTTVRAGVNFQMRPDATGFVASLPLALRRAANGCGWDRAPAGQPPGRAGWPGPARRPARHRARPTGAGSGPLCERTGLGWPSLAANSSTRPDTSPAWRSARRVVTRLACTVPD